MEILFSLAVLATVFLSFIGLLIWLIPDLLRQAPNSTIFGAVCFALMCGGAWTTYTTHDKWSNDLTTANYVFVAMLVVGVISFLLALVLTAWSTRGTTSTQPD